MPSTMPGLHRRVEKRPVAAHTHTLRSARTHTAKRTVLRSFVSPERLQVLQTGAASRWHVQATSAQLPTTFIGALNWSATVTLSATSALPRTANIKRTNTATSPGPTTRVVGGYHVHSKIGNPGTAIGRARELDAHITLDSRTATQPHTYSVPEHAKNL